MQRKLHQLLNNYRKQTKVDVMERLAHQKRQVTANVHQLLGDLIANIILIACLLFTTFIVSISLSFSLAIVFGSHILGFLGAAFCLSLTALLLLWKRPKIKRYFTGLHIANYFEKRKEIKENNMNASIHPSLFKTVDGPKHEKEQTHF